MAGSLITLFGVAWFRRPAFTYDGVHLGPGPGMGLIVQSQRRAWELLTEGSHDSGDWSHHSLGLSLPLRTQGDRSFIFWNLGDLSGLLLVCLENMGYIRLHEQ